MRNVYHLGYQWISCGIYNLILVAHLCTFMISLFGTRIGYVGNKK